MYSFYLQQFLPSSLSWSVCLYQKQKIWKSTKFGDQGGINWRMANALTEYSEYVFGYCRITILRGIYTSSTLCYQFLFLASSLGDILLLDLLLFCFLASLLLRTCCISVREL